MSINDNVVGEPGLPSESTSLGAGLGTRLGAARKAAGVGVRELARQIGVSPGLISQIENGRTAPSVSTLYAIATALGLSFDHLFRGTTNAPVGQAASSPPEVKVQHEPERPTVRLASGVRWEHLTWRTRADFEFLHVVYESGSASCEPGMLLQHGGEEYAFMLTGQLNLTVGGETFTIGPGDSISFDAQQPHRIWNAGATAAAAIWIVLQRRFDERTA